jgi:eukaryotic-like serine/threonine-protein kinase
MGAVYEATDLRINRQVAIKILSGAKFGNREALSRFEREAQTAGKLNHPNIVTVFDYGVLSTEGAFLVMELVRGETLSEVLRREGKLDSETVSTWFGQVLDGVETAHKAGIIHRDLKPDNIFVESKDGQPVRLCILDFGLARFNEHQFAESVTMPGTVMGTLGYMAPEQLRGEKADERSDLFATGVMIYECMHGERPFVGGTYMEIMQSMSKGVNLDPTDPFAKFFEQSLAQIPMMRFDSSSEMKRGLMHLIP